MAEDTGQPDKAPETETDATAEKESVGAEATTATTEAEKKAPATALTREDDAEHVAASDWPDDWRERMAAATIGKSEGTEYDKTLKRLQRMPSPEHPLKSFLNLETKFKKGEEADPFPDEGTDEEKTAWRDKHGVPAEGKGYLDGLKLDDGLVIGDNDKPAVDEFVNAMHSKNRPKEVVQDAINSYFKIRDKQIQERADKDLADENETREALREDWQGADYKKNLGAVYAFVEEAPEEVRDQILGARLADGTLLGNHGPTLKWLAEKSLELNPAATVVPGSGAKAMDSIKSEIADLEKMMEDNHSDYYRGAKSEQLQARYRELVDAQEKIDRRGRAA